MVNLVKSAGETVSASSTAADAETASLFSDIAVVAIQIDEVLAALIDAGRDSPCFEWLPTAAQTLALQIGFLADLGAKRAGGGQHRGNAENWLVSADRRRASAGDGI